MEPGVFVQHCLLAIVAARAAPGVVSGSEEEYSLQGVCYRYSVPADTEFGEEGTDALFGPSGKQQRQVAVYLRLLARDAGTTRVLLRCHFQSARGQWREMQRHLIGRVLDFPNEGEVVADLAFNLPYLRIGGFGLHALTVHFRSAEVRGEVGPDELPAWQDEDEWDTEPGWASGATEYLEIVRGT
jgi:hypothetical protein